MPMRMVYIYQSACTYMRKSVSSDADSKSLILSVLAATFVDPDQGRQNVSPDLDPNCLIVSLEKVIFEKSPQTITKA